MIYTGSKSSHRLYILSYFLWIFRLLSFHLALLSTSIVVYIACHFYFQIIHLVIETMNAVHDTMNYKDDQAKMRCNNEIRYRTKQDVCRRCDNSKVQSW